MSTRVPVLDVSAVDLTCRLTKEAKYEDFCASIIQASLGFLK